MFRQRSVIGFSLLWLVLPVFPRSAKDQAMRDPRLFDLIARWDDAYRHQDAKALARLETDDVEIVDRFGTLHRPHGIVER